MTRLMRALLPIALVAVLLVLTASTGATAQASGRMLYFVGDSITAGVGVGGGNEWRDGYPARARNVICGAGCTQTRVVGHGGQCLVFTGCGYGQPLVATYRHDVLEANPAPTEVLILIGINDLAHVSDWDLQNAYLTLFNISSARGVPVYFGTLIPTGPSLGWRGYVEAQRLRINAWLRAAWPSRVIDFAAPLTNGNGDLWGDYDSGDGLHPNWRGTVRMADMVTGAGL